MRSTALNEIAQSKLPSAVSGGRQNESAQELQAMREQFSSSSAPLFFDKAHDDFLSKLHDDFNTRYTMIRICCIAVEIIISMCAGGLGTDTFGKIVAVVPPR